MTSPTENTEELKKAITKLLRDCGVCKCGRHTDSTNFAYHICIEQGLRFKILEEIEAYTDQAVQAFGKKVLKEQDTADSIERENNTGYAVMVVPVSVITSLMKDKA
jgi:hypothetical protein